MAKIIAVLCAVALCLPHATHAQSESAAVGYAGLVLTPVGAFTPVITGRLNAGARSTGVQLRVSRWDFGEGDDGALSLGAGVSVARGKARTALEVGYVRNSQCSDCAFLMAGADVQYDLAQSSGSGATFAALLNPAVGVGIPREGGGTLITVGLSVPLSASINAGEQLRLVPYVSPGFGFSMATGSGDTRTGSRATVAGGIGLGGQSSPVLVSLSARKVFLDGAPTIYGIGLLFAR